MFATPLTSIPASRCYDTYYNICRPGFLSGVEVLANDMSQRKRESVIKVILSALAANKPKKVCASYIALGQISSSYLYLFLNMSYFPLFNHYCSNVIIFN